MDIGQAVAAMREGKSITRAGWNGKGMWLYLVPADVDSAGTTLRLPYVMMRTVSGALVPWLCSQTDLLATDWKVGTD